MSTPPQRRIVVGRAPTPRRAFACALVAAVLVVASCVRENDPTGPGAAGAAGLYLQPSIVPTAADASALPINRIRYAVVEAATSTRLTEGAVDVDPTSAEWVLDIEVPLRTSPSLVVLLTELVHVDAGGVELTQYAGTSDTLSVARGETTSPAEVPFVRGPLANLYVDSVRVGDLSGSEIRVGERFDLPASVLTSRPELLDGIVVFWTSLDSAVARAEGSEGIAVAEGEVAVVATAGASSDTLDVRILGVPVAAVLLDPDSLDLSVGERTTVTATLLDGGGEVLAGRDIAWSIGDSTVASVSQDGEVTARAEGLTVLTATSEGVSGTAPVRVGPPDSLVVTEVRIQPDSTAILVGGSTTLLAEVLNSAGEELVGREVRWASADVAIATVDSLTGVVSGIAEGVVDITATSEGVVGAAIVSVVTTPPNATYATAANTELVVGGATRPDTPHAYDGTNLLSGATGIEVTSTSPITTVQGGSVEVEPNGDFRYLPPAGLPGEMADTFSFTASGGSTSTVQIQIWRPVLYVDNTAAPGGSGRSWEPFATLAEAGAASGVGNVIYVVEGDGTTSGLDAGIVLQDGQDLIGSGVALNVPPVGVLAPAGNLPTLTNLSGPGVMMANANHVAGLAIVDPLGAAIEADNVGFGGLDSLTIVASNDAALRFTDASGTWTSTDLDITSSSPAGGLVVLRGDPDLTLDIADGTFENLPGAGHAIQVDTTTGGAVAVQGGDVHERGAGIVVRGAAGDVTIASFLDVDSTSSDGVYLLRNSGAMAFDSVDVATNGTTAIYTGANLGTIDIVGRVEAEGDYGWNGQCSPGTPAPCGEINARFSAFLVNNDETGTRTRGLMMVRAPAFIEIDTLDIVIGTGWTAGAGIQLLDMSYGGSLTITSPTSRIISPALAGLDILAGPAQSLNPSPINVTVDITLATVQATGGRGYSAANICACGVDGRLEILDADGGINARLGSVDIVYGGTGGATLDSLNNSSIQLTDASDGVTFTNSTNTSVSATGPISGLLRATINPGSTIEAPNPANSVTGTFGPVVHIEDTEIGPAGVTFESVSATTGSSAIVLRGTGLSGGLTITGDGSTLGSGGVIDVSAGTVPAIEIDGSTTNGTYVGALADLSLIDVTAAIDTAGVFVTDADVTLGGLDVSGGRTGVWVAANDSATASISNSSVQSSDQGIVATGATANSAVTLSVRDGVISGVTNDGIALGDRGVFDVDLRDNTIDGVTSGHAIVATATEGRHRIHLEGNTVRNVAADHGISIVGSGPATGAGSSTEYAVTMVGNDVVMPATPGLLAIELAGRQGRSIGCFDLRANTAVGGTGESGIGVNDDDPPGGLPVLLFERLLGGTGSTNDQAVVEAHIESDNPAATASDATAALVTGVPDGACATYFDSPNQVPLADAGGPYLAEVGDSVFLDASGSYDPAPGRIVSYEWFVDGVSLSQGTDPALWYTCAIEGQFVADLVVTDDRGDTSIRSATLECRVTRFLARWVDEAGTPIDTIQVGEVAELQLCFLENDLTAFQANVGANRWGTAYGVIDSVGSFDSSAPRAHPDCAGTTDIVTDVEAGADLTGDFRVTALSTAPGPGVGAQGVLSLFFTFPQSFLFDEFWHRDVFRLVVLGTFDGDPPPFFVDVPDLWIEP